MKKRQDFPSIEEKMADLKERVGFDLIKAVNNDENNVKSAGCGCGTCSKCGAKKNKKILIEDLRNILQYIASFSADRPEAGYGSVITHCREHPKLGFDKIEGKIDHGKFKTMVESILKKHKIDPEAVEYTPEADMPSSYEDDVADYYSHAIG